MTAESSAGNCIEPGFGFGLIEPGDFDGLPRLALPARDRDLRPFYPPSWAPVSGWL
jgi:hypothetical protein